MSMESLDSLVRNIEVLYCDKEIFVETSIGKGRNIAVDSDSRIRIIKLLDPEITNRDGRVYVINGTAFLTSYVECEKHIKTKRRILFGFKNLFDGIKINLFPSLVDHLWSGGDIKEFEQRYLSSYPIEKLSKAKLKEVMNLASITYNEKGVVVLSDVNPIKPWVGKLEEKFEGNTMHYGSDYFLDSLNLPIGINAKEAEFSFESEGFLKVSDGRTDNIGRYKNGILTLEDANIVINGVDDQIKWSTNPIRARYNLRETFLRSLEGFLCGGFVGLLGGFVVGGLISIGCAVISDPGAKCYVIINILSPLAFGLGTGVLGAYLENGGVERGTMRRLSKNCIQEIEGNAYLKAGFFGDLKDYRKDINHE